MQENKPTHWVVRLLPPVMGLLLALATYGMIELNNDVSGYGAQLLLIYGIVFLAPVLLATIVLSAIQLMEESLMPKALLWLWIPALIVCFPMLKDAVLAPIPYDDETQANTPAKPKQTDSVAVSVDWVNYNHVNTFDFTIYDLTVPDAPAIGGGGVNVLDSGGSKSCCVSLPLQWRPGLKVMLKWNEADRDNILGEWKKEYEIPRYTKPGDLFVVFNTDHTVDLVVSPAEPGSPKWAGKIKETPMAKCFAEFGKKECKRWLPNPNAGMLEACELIPDKENCSDLIKFCKEHPDDDT